MTVIHRQNDEGDRIQKQPKNLDSAIIPLRKVRFGYGSQLYGRTIKQR